MKTLIAALFTCLVGCSSISRPDYTVDAMGELLYLNAARYIEQDTALLPYLLSSEQRPLKVKVFDTVTCFSYSYADIDGFVEWLRPGEPDWKYQYIRDSVWQIDAHRIWCRPGRNVKLAKLSTRSDPMVALLFDQIDSVFVEGYYCVPATLYYSPMVEYGRGRPSQTPEDLALASKAIVTYFLIFDRQAGFQRAFSTIISR